jgi:hypothetical protein
MDRPARPKSVYLRLSVPLLAALGALTCGAAVSQDPRPQGDTLEQEQRHVRKPLPTPEELAQLPPDGGPEFNRLVFEQSPYLLQHAGNPVDWYPWGDAAFERAQAEDKLVFLSIGYSTCHWCHVMEHESFEDEEVARLMNEAFVCVKVDREERPDVDDVYMSFLHANGQRGGWPMTVLLTADKEPLWGGTYFPKDQRGQRPGMLQIVPHFRDGWRENKEAWRESAAQFTELLARQQSDTSGAALTEESLAQALAQFAGSYDPEYGGFGQAPKFPIPHTHRFLLRAFARTGDDRALEMVENTFDHIVVGGVWDQLGYGFHRYSTDRTWFLPHFEKMLYDQALLAMAYTELWQITREPRHRRTVERTLEYVLRDMTDPLGGFYSAEDADSEGEEAVFYIWTEAQMQAVLGDEAGARAARYWGVEDGGNFIDQGSGQKVGASLLHLPRDPLTVAVERGVEPAELEAELEAWRAALFAAREERVHPLKDDKVLADWNGLMIAAFALAGRALDEPRYTTAAARAADFVLARMRDDEGRLYKRWRGGAAALDSMLEDHAFVIWGLLELYQSTLEPRWLREALALQAVQDAHFWDAGAGGYYMSPDDGEELIVRAKKIYDGAIPSGNSVAVLNLARLARLTGDTAHEERAWEVVKAFGGEVAKNGVSSHPQLLVAVDFLLGPSHEVVVVGDPQAEDTRAMLRALRDGFRPNDVLLLRPPGTAPEIVALAPFTAEHTQLAGRATAYVCENFACQAPTADIAQMLANLDTPESDD